MDWRALMASRTFMVFPDEAKDAAVEGKGSKETSERCRSLLARSTSAGSRAKSRDRRRKHVLVKESPASKLLQDRCHHGVVVRSRFSARSRATASSSDRSAGQP